MLRLKWRGLETELRSGLHGHERGNPGYRQGHDLTGHRASPRPDLFSSTREALGAGASVREILIKPEPFLHQLEHVTALHLGMLLRNGLLQLGEVTLAAVASHTGLPMLLAALPGSENELLG